MYDRNCNCVLKEGDGLIPLEFSDIGKCNWKCPHKVKCEHLKLMKDFHLIEKERKETVKNIISKAIKAANDAIN